CANFIQPDTVRVNSRSVITSTAGSLDSTIQCSNTAKIAATLALAPSATDNCTASPTIHLISDVNTPSTSCANAYVRVRTWNFTEIGRASCRKIVQRIVV